MVNVIWGSNREKPESSQALSEFFTDLDDSSGYLYIGYPVVGSPLGPIKFDALLISEQAGLIAFDLVEGTELGDFKSRQDEVASMLEVKLKPYPSLKTGRNLKFEITVITFAPAKKNLPVAEDPYVICNSDTLADTVKSFKWINTPATYASLVAAIQVVTNIRAGRSKREPLKINSLGARLKKVEDSIANLDQQQSQAVIETVEGVQRVRGLAGSGKTIVLALKVAYLHAQNPDWKIAVTFNTRSLKDQFRRLINNFTIEHTGAEPDWERIDILNAWGGPGEKEKDGIYHKFCRAHGIDFVDFGTAKSKFSSNKEFEGVCFDALRKVKSEHVEYDMILIDEAQDFSPEFLKLCYQFLKPPKRLVYAYDELQTLTGNAVLPPEELFGKDQSGEPTVRFLTPEVSAPKQDIILEKCYRNSRPLLATAHALGFGIYRKGGLVQFFDQDNLWTDVGYSVLEGELNGGTQVKLARSPQASPLFLENHSPLTDLIQFHKFENSEDQTKWLVQSIKNDIQTEELRPEDVVVINPNPLTTIKAVGTARQLLFSAGINSELAGVSTSRDVFSKAGAVTFTGIFRAKGNEAGMVYIINAHDCFSAFSKSQLALVRNQLFTAITRSKAWVRVLGYGNEMSGLIAEWEALKSNDYQLAFKYPTATEKQQLRLINKGLTQKQKTRQKRLNAQAKEVLAAMKNGELAPDLVKEFQDINDNSIS